ncbi:MAG TPA: cupredoxin domain-containing protein [Symbiobacteriaceae bacterium]|nr:cupredoxin domain-containing protein [Symbiobacteriaceae bacterium]
MRRWAWVALGLVALVGLTAGCGTASKQEEAEKEQEVTIDLADYRFIANSINLEVGTLLEVKLRNTSSQKHEMVIDTPEGEYEVEVDAGESLGFGIKFRQPGTYAFKCELPGHLEQGMKGEIVVKGKGTAAKFARDEGGGEEIKQEVKLALSDFKFDPEVVTTNAGTLLEFAIENSSGQPHEMVIDGKSAEFEIEVDGGKTLDFGVKYRQKGTFEYKCELPGHVEQGMKGKIVVQ